MGRPDSDTSRSGPTLSLDSERPALRRAVPSALRGPSGCPPPARTSPSPRSLPRSLPRPLRPREAQATVALGADTRSASFPCRPGDASAQARGRNTAVALARPPPPPAHPASRESSRSPPRRRPLPPSAGPPVQPVTSLRPESFRGTDLTTAASLSGGSPPSTAEAGRGRGRQARGVGFAPAATTACGPRAPGPRGRGLSGRGGRASGSVSATHGSLTLRRAPSRLSGFTLHAASSRKPPWRRVAGSPPSLVAAAGFTGQASTPWPERQGWPGPRPMDKASVDTATPCPGRACWSGSPSPHHVSPWMLGRDAVLGDRHPDTPPLLWGYPPTGPRTPTQEASRSAAEGRGGEAHGSPHPEVPAKTRDASWTPSVGRGPSLPCVCGRSAPGPGVTGAAATEGPRR